MIKLNEHINNTIKYIRNSEKELKQISKYIENELEKDGISVKIVIISETNSLLFEDKNSIDEECYGHIFFDNTIETSPEHKYIANKIKKIIKKSKVNMREINTKNKIIKKLEIS